MGDPTGGFTILVKKPERYRADKSLIRIWLDPEDVWVELIWICEGQQIHTMTGLVDHVAETMTRMPGGKRVETFTITGRDIGKPFAETQLWLNLFAYGEGQLVGIGPYMNAILDSGLDGNPSEWIRRWVEVWLGNNGLAEQQWLLPGSMGGSTFFDKLDLDGLEEMNAGNGNMVNPSVLDVDLSKGFGRLWDTLSSYSNDLLNEMWTDLAPPEFEDDDQSALAPTLYLRERPFPVYGDRSKWDTIRQHVIEPRDIASRRITKGGEANRYNYWMISSTGLIDIGEQGFVQGGVIDGSKLGEPGNIPIWNTDSIRRHGVRRWMKSSIHLAVDPVVLSSLAAVWLRRVHDWYSIAPMQGTGTFGTNRPLPEIRVGQRLLEKRAEGDMEFYVEGVSHIWQYPNASTTTLTVTRGEYVDDNLLGAIYKETKNPKTLSQADCAPDSSLGDFIDALAGQQCKFTPEDTQRGANPVLSHGDSITLERPDASSVEQAGKALLSEGGGLGSSAANSPKGTKGGMIPPKDRMNQQAKEIAEGNPNARLKKPPRGPFDQDALERGDDPLAGFDDDSIGGDDPLFGLEEDL
jgi:hypothetical protein